MITAMFVLAAVLPAAFLMNYIYKKDAIEKEPRDLLIKLLIAGCLSTIPAVIIELVLGYVIDMILPAGSLIYNFIYAFLIVALAEEGSKYFFLKRRTWDHPAFNYEFDGVVYAVFVSLGFAALENLGYVFQYGLTVALTRAVLSVPAHMGFAVFMGSLYGRAKQKESDGNPSGASLDRMAGVVVAVLLHGFYDMCLMHETTMSIVAFFIFVVVMYIIVIKKIKADAAHDKEI